MEVLRGDQGWGDQQEGESRLGHMVPLQQVCGRGREQSLWKSRKSPDGVTWVRSSRCVGGRGSKVCGGVGNPLMGSHGSAPAGVWAGEGGFQLLLALNQSLWRNKKSPSIPVVSVSKKHSSAQ